MMRFTRRATRRFGPLLMVAVLAGACQQEDDQNAVSQAETELLQAPRPARIFTVSHQTGSLARRFAGRVEAVQTVDLSFQVAGKLMELPVLESQKVAKDDLIARLDPTDYELAVRQAELKLKQAKQDLQRLETLKERSVISEKSYDDQKNDYDLAVEALNVARRNLDYTEIRAPFDGIITRRLVDNFTTVAAGTAVLRIQDVSETQIDINVPEALFSGLSDNKIEAVYAEFPAIPGKKFALTYREHSTEPDAVTQTYKVTLAMANRPEEPIYPGMTASVEVTLKPKAMELQDGFLVPTAAVAVESDHSAYVWRFDAKENVVTRVPVKIGVVMGDFIPVIEGVQQGDEIVSAGVAYLSEGQAIQPLR